MTTAHKKLALAQAYRQFAAELADKASATARRNASEAVRLAKEARGERVRAGFYTQHAIAADERAHYAHAKV